MEGTMTVLTRISSCGMAAAMALLVTIPMVLAQAKGEPIKIGLLTPMTGNVAR
jgi:hypothetical protein